MKRIFLYSVFIIAAVACMTAISAASDAAVAHNWFCKRTSSGTVPALDPEFAFTEGHNVLYVDESASDSNKKIYLTFDAGYENGNVEKILDVLKEKHVSGAFFILENLAKRNPDLVKRMSEEGHLVCNHTAVHRDMTAVTDKAQFEAELERLNDAVLQNCGVEVAPFFRPPEGRFNENCLIWADELGYKTVFWSFAYADWDNEHQPDPRASVDKILQNVHPGEIMLLHPTSSTNAAILGEVIDSIKEMGYTFGSLEEVPEC